MWLSRQIRWTSVFAEGAIIVVSILLAFAIQAWWEGSKERAEEKRILAAVRAEVLTNVAYIDSELEYRNAANANIQAIFDTAGNDSDLKTDEADRLLANLVWWGDIEFASGALDGLIQGGRLPVVQNETLRQRLAALPDEYAYVDRIEKQTYESMRDILVPYLIDNTFFPQIASHWSDGRPGSGGTVQTPVTYPAGPASDHRAVFRDSVFLGILVLRRADHDDAIHGYRYLRSHLTDLVEAVEREIER